MLIRQNCNPLYEKSLNRAIGLTREGMKRRAVRLRYLIDHIKNKKARKEVIAEYVSLIQQINLHN